VTVRCASYNPLARDSPSAPAAALPLGRREVLTRPRRRATRGEGARSAPLCPLRVHAPRPLANREPVRTVVAKVPYSAIKAEAGKVGLLWPDITGLLVQTFDDGTAVVVVQPGDNPAAESFVAHLVDVGMAEDA
jgi:hypothetical protein